MRICLHICLCTTIACLVPVSVRRSSQITWSWSYRLLWATIWVLQEPKSSEREVNALTCWAISQSLHLTFWGRVSHWIWSLSIQLISLTNNLQSPTDLALWLWQHITMTSFFSFLMWLLWGAKVRSLFLCDKNFTTEHSLGHHFQFLTQFESS